MAGKIKLYGPSGYTELAADENANDNTLTLPASGTLATDADLSTKLDVSTAASTYLPISTAADTYLPIAGGKILQIVRATDSTSRSTTSTAFVDVPGMSVTITPQKSDSAVIIVANYFAVVPVGQKMELRISDASNNAISGAEEDGTRPSATTGQSMNVKQTSIAFATPATTSAVTFKLRFSITGSTGSIRNDLSTGQMYAIEVSA